MTPTTRAGDGNASIPTIIRTERMMMRPWEPDDAPLLEPILRANVAHLAPWIPAHVATPLPSALLAERLRGFAADFAGGRGYRYALLAIEDGRILGEADLFPRSAAGRVPIADADRMEIGYWLDAAVTGQGYVTEAARALLGVAGQLPGIGHVEIRCDARNAPSAAVPRRLGFALVDVDDDLQVWSIEARRA